MSYESKLAQSIQSDYLRNAAIERTWSSRNISGTVLARAVLTLVVLAVIIDLMLVGTTG